MKKKNVTFKGIISPYKWVEEKIEELSINTVDGDDFIILESPQGKKLSQCINEFVKVTGEVNANENGNLTIKVKGFQMLKGNCIKGKYSVPDDNDE